MNNVEKGKERHRPAVSDGGGAFARDVNRRDIISKFGVGAVCAVIGVPVIMSFRSLVPNALYEMPQRFKAGKVDQFADGPTFIADHRVYIFRDGRTFHCIGAACTHLGCTVQLVKLDRPREGEEFEFHCPCHGSKFRGDGSNISGPAPRPLDYFQLELAPDDGQLIVDISQVANKAWRLSV